MLDVSVVIPTFRDDVELRGLLRALTPVPVAEIIIVDGERRAVPPQFINSAQNIKWRSAPRGRGAQIAAGIEFAAQPIIWVLHADNRPTAECLPEIKRHLADPKTSLTCFPLAFRTQKLALSLFALMSRIDSPMTTFGDQAYAFRRTDYRQLRLALSEFPLLEDVALRKALRGMGKVRKSRTPLLTSARRFDRLGVWRTQLRNLGILISYWRGASPAALHMRYYQPTRRTALTFRPSSPARQVSMRVRAAAQKTVSD